MIDDIPATLRRRARELEKIGFPAQKVTVLLRAADELQVRRRAARHEPGSDENIALELLADNRRLRAVLVGLFDVVRISDMKVNARKDALEKIRAALVTKREIGKGRAVLALEVLPEHTRAELEARMASVLDAHFAGGQHGEEAEAEGLVEGDGGREADPPDGGAAPDAPHAPDEDRGAREPGQ